MNEDDDQKMRDLDANRQIAKESREMTRAFWRKLGHPAQKVVEERNAIIKAALHHLDLMEPGNLAHQKAQVVHLLRSLLPEDTVRPDA